MNFSIFVPMGENLGRTAWPNVVTWCKQVWSRGANANPNTTTRRIPPCTF